MIVWERRRRERRSWLVQWRRGWEVSIVGDRRRRVRCKYLGSWLVHGRRG